MKIAIIYQSLTGNTELIAKAIQTVLKDEVIYFGKPKENIEADLYFVGSWTDKGTCCEAIADFLKTLENKKIAYFGTAGFGGSAEYYQLIGNRALCHVDDSNVVENSFFCQGKMPMAVRDRFVKMIQEHPEDKNLEVSVNNFDEAFNHPNQNDLDQAKIWAKNVRDHIR